MENVIYYSKYLDKIRRKYIAGNCRDKKLERIISKLVWWRDENNASQVR